MPHKQYRLDDDAVRILEEHRGRSTTLSDAVRNMELKLTHMTQVVTNPVTKVSQPETKVTHPITQHVSGTGFSRGNGAPSPAEPLHVTEQKKLAREYLKDKEVIPGEPTIKKYGKFEPGEELQEPRGFGGKKV